MTIELNPELEQRVSEQAKARGVSVEEYVRDVLEQELADSEPSLQETLSPEEWSRELDRWASEFPQQPVLSNEAPSRESIYGDD